MDTEDFQQNYPDEEFQKWWIRQYLEFWLQFSGKREAVVSDSEVERLRTEANDCAAVSSYKML